MHFNSKKEAYTYIIACLYQYKKNYPKLSELIHNCIEELKILFENHNQDPKQICPYLDNVKIEMAKLGLSQPANKLAKIIACLATNKFKQTPEQKFENPLGRRAESELFTLLLLKPTNAMMESVKQVSDRIIETLVNTDKTLYQKQIKNFLKSLEEISSVIACGAFKDKPLLAEVINICRKIRHNHYPK